MVGFLFQKVEWYAIYLMIKQASEAPQSQVLSPAPSPISVDIADFVALLATFQTSEFRSSNRLTSEDP
jgi:hypothetical protein